MLIYSTQLGDVDVPEDKIISFSHGLPGFPDEKAFAFVPYQAESPFAYLQSLTEPALTFLVVDPFTFFQDYEFELNDQIAQELELLPSNLPHIITIVNVPVKTEEMTTNLLAPIVINTQNNQAVQSILEKTTYTTRHRLFSEEMLDSSSKEGPR